MKIQIPLAVVFVIAGCSSVIMMDGSEGPMSDKSCDVRVFQTHAQALKQGPIDELCTIEGTSAPGFDHSVPAAIAKHKDKACGCGATGVYVQSRSQPGVLSGPATVSMVAFRYVSQAPQRSAATQPSAKLAVNPAAAMATTDAETAKVVQVLVASGFPLVGEPLRFKQIGGRGFYEARGAQGQVTQVVCDAAGGCRIRTIYD
jgi:hypothetical protein